MTTELLDITKAEPCTSQHAGEVINVSTGAPDGKKWGDPRVGAFKEGDRDSCSITALVSRQH